MVNKERIKNTIEETDTIEDLLILSKNYYSAIPINIRSMIFNQVIFQRKMDSEDVHFSIKLATNLSLLFMSYPINKKSYLYFLHDIKIYHEIEIFRILIFKFHNLYTIQQTEQMVNHEYGFFSTFLNYHFHYSSISIGDYLEIFKLFEAVSNKIYGFSIYKFSKILLFLTSDTSYKPNEAAIKITNAWISNKQMHQYFNNGLPAEIISNIFIDESEIKPDIIYPTDITKIFRGKIGIKFKKGYFVPQCAFIFENILRQLIESPEANDTKGEILENHVSEILQDFFGKESVIKTFFDECGNEQDILVKYKNFILSIECKAQDFKEVFRNHEQAIKRLTRRFKQIILKGCEQCERVKENIYTNSSVCYYDSDDKKDRNKIIEISNTKKIEVLKIVVTLDDYLNLSESPHEFLDNKYKDTWVVNLFSLKKILWISNKEEFINYVKYRTSSLETIKSINSDELEQFGYFTSPNFNFYPPNNLGITINLMNGFSKIFDSYDVYSFEKEIARLDEYLYK